MSTTRFALIGAGSMASTYHYPSLAEFADVELAAVCDIAEERRQTIASRLGIPRQYSNYRQMLDETKPQAVCIFMAPHLLFDIVIDCLRRGLHVFIEKPPGVSSFQTHAMARTAADNHCLTMVGFNRRHDPLLNAALREARQVGSLTQVHGTFFKGESAIYYDGAADVITCDAIHAIDTIRYMAGSRVVGVQSMVGQYDSPVPNAWNALIHFDSGVMGILQSNWSTGGRIHRFEVHSVGYSAYVEQLTGLEELHRKGRERRRRSPEEVMGSADAADPRKLNGFYQQARHFVDCIQANRQPSSHFADAARTMDLVDRINSGYRVSAAPLDR